MELGKTVGHGDLADRGGDSGHGGGDPGSGPAAVAELELPPGIPASIPFERVQELITALGLPLNHLLSFSVHAHAIEAEFRALNEDGRPFLLDGSGELAIHKVAIRIER